MLLPLVARASTDKLFVFGTKQMVETACLPWNIRAAMLGLPQVGIWPTIVLRVLAQYTVIVHVSATDITTASSNPDSRICGSVERNPFV